MAGFQAPSSLCLGVLASHAGTNFQAILDRCLSGELPARVGVVISNNSHSGAIDRAQMAHIPTRHLSSKTHPDPQKLDAVMTRVLHEHQVNLVVLAGYMKKLGPQLLADFYPRVINIHPSLLPTFGGKGMFGLSIHKAVIDQGVRFTGVTVHIVERDYDRGPILMQEIVAVLPDDMPEVLANRVLEVEHRLYSAVIRQFAKHQLCVCEGRARFINLTTQK